MTSPRANFSFVSAGSNPIKNTPKKLEKIKIHFLKFTFSFKKIELNKIPKGIDNCAPIIVGAKMSAT